MTTPDERTRNLLQAGAFLKELERDVSVPQPIRSEARRLLRHYPTRMDVAQLAKVEQHFVGSFLLTPNIDPAWFVDYKFGAHTGS